VLGKASSGDRARFRARGLWPRAHERAQTELGGSLDNERGEWQCSNHYEEVAGPLDHSAYPSVTVDIDLTRRTPANASGPVPVKMEFGWSPEFLASLAQRFPEMNASRPGPHGGSRFSPKVGLRHLCPPTSVQADKGEGLTQGVIGW
jgi:hypothetical protein